MHRHKFSIVLLLLLAMSFTLLAPVSAAHAAALSGQSGQDGGSSGSNILNILLGLLLGKLLGGSSGGSDIGQVLGLSTTPASSGTAAPAGADRSAVITTAQKYMGVPYVWGGETPDGFDCSGFTQYVMKQNGITIPRTAAEQFAAGTAVDKANLQVGDLIFFTTYKPGASHVGFYMGGGKFIHASSAAKAVTVSNLDEAYYTQHYIGARRY